MCGINRRGFLTFVWLWLSSAQAQPVAVPSPADRTVSPQAWQKATAHLDYSRDIPAPAEEPKELEEVLQEVLPDALRYGWEKGLLYGISALLLAAVGWWLFQISPAWTGQGPDAETEALVPITSRAMDGPPLPGECRLLLQQALAAQEYRLAARAHFLLLVGHLAQRGAIRWAKEKTNGHYVREMSNTPRAEPFRRAVEMFERIWYGQMPLDQHTYETAVAPVFDGLLDQTVSVTANSGDTRQHPPL